MPAAQRKNIILPVRNAVDVEIARDQCNAEARENFWKFRQRVHPDLLQAAWQADVAEHLQQFYEDYCNNRKPKLLLQAPPQHGKTYQIEDFIAWFAGKEPDSKTIFASYSDELGIRVNLAMQRMLTSPRYREVFKNTRIAGQNTVTLSGRYQRNSSMLEFVGYKGSFRNTTIMGQINGQGLDLGVIDDPIKGRAEANSKVTRDKAWGFLMDDFFGRFSEKAGILMIQTRWHVDDPTGRWLQTFPETKVCRYPAIATEDETFRNKGEALFPQLKSIEFLNERKKGMTNASFEAQYQQSPFVQGGGMFPIEKIGVLSQMLVTEVKKSVCYIDKAGTEDGGAYTAIVLMHFLKDGRTVVEDVRRGQWSALTREQRIMQTVTSYKAKYSNVKIYVEQEPGSGGKESAENTVRMLRGFRVEADKPTGDKVIRADPYAAQVQGGNVLICAAPWNVDYLDELETFPNGKYLDQVDASSGAFMKLSLGYIYDSSQAWLGDLH